MFESAIKRRSLLSGMALAASAVGLAGCGDSSGPAPGAGSQGSGEFQFPNYVPLSGGATPDLEGNGDGVQDVYFRYPEDRFEATSGEVGDGSAVRALVITYGQPPTPLPQNEYWQKINDVLNIDFQPGIVPAGEFYSKFATSMAGGDLPDLIQVPVFMGLPRLPDLARSVFTDLTETLGGSGIEKYKNLANIPTYAWRTAQIQGRIIGVPLERPPFGDVLYQRRDIIDELGLDPNPTSREEFVELCAALTSARDNRYALVGYSTDNGVSFADNIFGPMFGVPNRWAETDGKLERNFETEAYLEMAGFIKELWEAGYWHPDTPSLPVAQSVNAFFSGNVAMRADGMTWWTGQADYPDLLIDAMVPFSANGEDPGNYQGNGAFSFTALRKGASPERVDALLRVLNYAASPFGSEENFLIEFGVEGVDWELNENGAPVSTTQGVANRGINVKYLSSPPQVSFSPVRIDDALTRRYELQKKLVPMLVPDPTVGLYSESDQAASALNQSVGDRSTDYILGRGTLDEVKAAVEAWRTGGGNKIRAEYEEELAKNQ